MKRPDMAYEPFGPEWEKEMMRFTKKGLIALLRAQGEKGNKFLELTTKAPETDRECECGNPEWIIGPCLNCGGRPRVRG